MALINQENIIENIICYDGISEYTSPENLILQEVDNDKNIGDSIH